MGGAAFQCGICSRSFPTRHGLMYHQGNHRDRGWICDYCGYDFQNHQSLLQHKVATGHNPPVDFDCHRCGAIFPTTADLDDHMQFPSPCSDEFKAKEKKKAQKKKLDATPKVPAGPFSAGYVPPGDFLGAQNKRHASNLVPPSAPTPKKPRASENAQAPAVVPKSRASENAQAPAVVPKSTQAYTPSDKPTSPGVDGGNAETGPYCSVCEERFVSQARYNLHFLGCRPPLRSSHEPSTSNKPVMAAKKNQDLHLPSAKPTYSSMSPQQSGMPAKNDGPVQIQTAISAMPGPPAVRNVLSPPGVAEGKQVEKIAQSSTPTHGPVAPVGGSVTMIKCDAPGCNRSFRAEAALNIHKADVHGIGGPALDLLGKDSYMASQRAGNEMKQLGMLPSSRTTTPHQPGHIVSVKLPAFTKVSSEPARNPVPKTPAFTKVPTKPATIPPAMFTPPGSKAPASTKLPAKPTTIPPAMSRPPVSNAPATSLPMSTPSISLFRPTAATMTVTTPGEPGEPEDLEQADEISDLIMRLDLHRDMVIHDQGQIECSGVGWSRVKVAQQADLAPVFEKLCHLPKPLQSLEHVPRPKTFASDVRGDYPIADFEASPERSFMHPTYDVIALSCIKVTIKDNIQEAVKVAAVDVATGRVLMNHLVCMDPRTSVVDWNTFITGIRSFRDMESFRLDGFKIFKGWQSVRKALWKFIDRETIIVGHNLRSDLDALRMSHGRAVDIAKLVEKAANGPLSRPQLALESLCRDLPGKTLPAHTLFGIDVLQYAFAAREICLWKARNEEDFAQLAKSKSLDYQRVNPTARI